MTYQDALRILNSKTNFEKNRSQARGFHFDLSRVRAALTAVGAPDRQYPSVIVAGTNGKGTTATMLADLLTAHGLRAGLYTSPHVYDIRERICVDRDMIPAAAFARYIAAMVSRVPRVVFGQLTYFEVLTVVALMHFACERVDCAVLEVGLGGRLDATNVVDAAVAVITPVSFDHTELLGNTLAKIAREKAGVIKRGSVVVSAQQVPAVRQVIARVARNNGAARVDTVACSKEKVVAAWCMKGKRNVFGRHSIHNIAVAHETYCVLCARFRFPYATARVRRAVKAFVMPGRLEIVKRKPLTIIDVAHNEAGISAALKTVTERYPGRKVYAVLGMSSDKKLRMPSGFCSPSSLPSADLLPRGEGKAQALSQGERYGEGVYRKRTGTGHDFSFIITQSSSPRAMPSEELARRLRGTCAIIGIESNPRCAVRQVFRLATSRDIVLILGSFFLIADVRKYL